MGHDWLPDPTTCRACARDHGRLELPCRDDEETHRGRHRRDDHLLRHDRDLQPVSTQSAHGRLAERKRVGTVGRVARMSRSGSSSPITARTVPRGMPGEFWTTRGYSVMLGYWGQDDKTATRPSIDGWMRTGDLGAVDDDSYAQHHQADRDMVIRGGENVYPRDRGVHTHHDIPRRPGRRVPDEKSARNSAPGSACGRAPRPGRGAVRESADREVGAH